MTALSTIRLSIPCRGGEPILQPGARMKQPGFHRRYLNCPEDVKFELIDGTVYLAMPGNLSHSDAVGEIGFILNLYRRATIGAEALHNATTILGARSEVQPDLGLRILPEYGGQSGNSEDEEYVEGAPELVVEVAHSRRAVAMHGKRNDYERAGVVEYVVVCVEENELHWFHFPTGEAITPDRNGVAKSRVFPGLWLHVASVLARESSRVEEVARQGLASRAHAGFVRKLAARRK